jgi:hypothetical protein
MVHALHRCAQAAKNSKKSGWQEAVIQWQIP